MPPLRLNADEIDKMKFLVLTNNSVSQPLISWLETQGLVEVISEKLTKEDVNGFDLIISYNYHHIIPADLIDRRMINLHISYLPWNRGADPNLWSFLDDTPKGVTIHRISKDVDKGEILFQSRVYFDDETLESSYIDLHGEVRRLFIDKFFEILSLTNKGTYHSKKDSEEIRKRFGEKLWTMPIKEVKKWLSSQ